MASTNIDAESLPSPGSELIVQSLAVTGGTLLIVASRSPAPGGGIVGMGCAFQPASASGSTRLLSLTDAKADTGAPITATATGGAVGVSRTAGTSLVLVGEATSSNAKTDKALWEFDLPSSYVANANIAVSVDCSIGGTGTLTAASCTVTAAAYSEVNGVETALTISAAGTIVAAGSVLPFTITGTGLTPGSQLALELAMLVTTSTGVNTGTISSVSYVA